MVTGKRQTASGGIINTLFDLNFGDVCGTTLRYALYSAGPIKTTSKLISIVYSVIANSASNSAADARRIAPFSQPRS
jgi:hypothetical protein